MKRNDEEYFDSWFKQIVDSVLPGREVNQQRVHQFIQAIELKGDSYLFAMADFIISFYVMTETEYTGNNASLKPENIVRSFKENNFHSDYFLNYLFKKTTQYSTSPDRDHSSRCEFLLRRIKHNRQNLQAAEYLKPHWYLFPETDPQAMSPAAAAVTLHMSEDPIFKQFMKRAATLGKEKAVPQAQDTNAIIMLEKYDPILRQVFCYTPEVYLPLFQTEYFSQGCAAACARFSSDCTHILLDGDNTLKPKAESPQHLIDLQTGKSTFSIVTTDTKIRFHPTNQDLVGVKHKSKLSVINFRTGKKLSTHRIRACSEGFEYSPNGNFMAARTVPLLSSGHSEATLIQIFRLGENHRSQKLITELKSVINSSYCCYSFSPDEQLLKIWSKTKQSLQLYKQNNKGKWLQYSQLDLKPLNNVYGVNFSDSATLVIVTEDMCVFHCQISKGQVLFPPSPIVELSTTYHQLMNNPSLNTETYWVKLPSEARPLSFLGKDFYLYALLGQINIHHRKTGEYICHIETRKKETAYFMRPSANNQFLVLSYYDKCGPIIISLPTREELIDRLTYNRGILQQAHEYNASISKIHDEHLVQNTKPAPSAPAVKRNSMDLKPPKLPSLQKRSNSSVEDLTQISTISELDAAEKAMLLRHEKAWDKLLADYKQRLSPFLSEKELKYVFQGLNPEKIRLGLNKQGITDVSDQQLIQKIPLLLQTRYVGVLSQRKQGAPAQSQTNQQSYTPGFYQPTTKKPGSTEYSASAQPPI